MMRKLSTILTIGFLLIISDQLKAQESGAIFFVRHAEVTYVDGDRNPELNEQGRQRGEKLETFFSDVDIVNVFSTNLKRTTSTASYVAKSKNLEVEFYDPFSEESVAKFKEASKSGNVLVVGHSNTVPSQVNALLGSEKYAQLGEKEYSKIFMVMNPTSSPSSLVFQSN